MKRLLLGFLLVPLVFGGVVPNRYIVEFSTEPAAAQAVRVHGRGERARAALRGEEGRRQRARVRAEQDQARIAIESEQGRVLETVDTVANAAVVEIPDARANRLTRVPGVRRVYPVREFHLVLDHAAALHRVPEAWSQVGIGSAGAGVKIALIDTGVDQEHPGFQDASLVVPDGYPKVNRQSDAAFTNNKVIVARSYASLFPRPDTDNSARDRVGHGTATAMCAAGVTNTGPLATITGIAPKAFVGSYKVFGTPGVNDTASEDAILKAIDDAVADGMDVINLSLGSDVPVRLEDDPETISIERAAGLGVIVVVAAGNNGPDPGTLGSPSGAPSAIVVGASANDRTFSASVKVGSSPAIVAIPGSGRNSIAPISASLTDVARLDGTGLACASLPANSLRGTIAFILRGTCTFEEKLTFAQAAGAVAALVYTYKEDPQAFTMGVGAATLPAQMVSYTDGVAIKEQAQATVQAVMSFTISPAYVNPARLASFSAKGPNVDYSIKPDLVAVGTNLYTAAQKFDSRGAIYDTTGYTLEQGTSFSSPIVAGAAAVLKAARPGLTSAQYRSLLVNSAAAASLVPGTTARVQQAGAGSLDLLAALNQTVAAAPVSIGFGAGGGDVNAARNLTLWNLGTASETYTLSPVGSGSGPVPSIEPSSVTLDPGASAQIAVRFNAAGLGGGQYEGYIAVQGSSGAPARIPYWYGVPTGVPANITVLETADSPRAGSQQSLAILFKVTDDTGIPVTGQDPEVTVVSGGASILSVRLRDSISPDAFAVAARMGLRGNNVFRIKVGDIVRDVTVSAQ